MCLDLANNLLFPIKTNKNKQKQNKTNKQEQRKKNDIHLKYLKLSFQSIFNWFVTKKGTHLGIKQNQTCFKQKLIQLLYLNINNFILLLPFIPLTSNGLCKGINRSIFHGAQLAMKQTKQKHNRASDLDLL